MAPSSANRPGITEEMLRNPKTKSLELIGQLEAIIKEQKRSATRMQRRLVRKDIDNEVDNEATPEPTPELVRKWRRIGILMHLLKLQGEAKEKAGGDELVKDKESGDKDDSGEKGGKVGEDSDKDVWGEEDDSDDSYDSGDSYEFDEGEDMGEDKELRGVLEELFKRNGY